MAGPTNIRQFEAELDRFESDSLDAAHTILRVVAIWSVGALVDKTPVHTGHARRNWQLTIGTPATGVVEGADPSGAGAKNAAFATPIPRGADVWVSNNVPYIEALEDGHSGQAPRGMLAPTFRELVETYSSQADEILSREGLI